MNKRPHAVILTGFGINCDMETEFAFRLAGALTEKVHINDLISSKKNLEEFVILAFPGGFSFGDDISSGKVLANKIKYNLSAKIEDFIKKGGLIIGICNGFQALVKMGLLPGFKGKYWEQTFTLTFNDSGRFEDRWVHLKVNHLAPCIFTKNIEFIDLPVRHGEGKFYTDMTGHMEELKKGEQIVMQYCNKNGNPSTGYPLNPNGSIEDIAGICDKSGRIFGLMPHPEAYLHPTNHPLWTRTDIKPEGMGLQIFHNAVNFAKKNLL
ncbi:MAG: phosphoribosylformylglycinamidine synthase I [Thermodesulfobacteriota bacterium]|nr:phosphoribosylformylglycinamidine synthase I [Thermodesulfobacteriota bacterium]